MIHRSLGRRLALAVLIAGAFPGSAAAAVTESAIVRGCKSSHFVIKGTGGNDKDLGQKVADSFPARVYGYGGDDVLHGHNARDCLYGGAGRDKLTSGVLMQSVLRGGSGADTLSVAGIGDFLHGDSGDDRIHADTNRDATNFSLVKFVDRIDCGRGYDTVWVGAYDRWDYRGISCEKVIFCPYRFSGGSAKRDSCRRLACKPPAKTCPRSQWTAIRADGSPRRRTTPKPPSGAPGVDTGTDTISAA